MKNKAKKPNLKIPVEDRFLIDDLIADYAWALDTGDEETFATCFAENSVVLEEVFEDADVWRGPEGAVAMLRHYANALGFPGRQHHVTQTQFTEFSGGFAKLRSFAFVTECHDEPPYELRFTGYYDDEIVKCEDGAWRFLKRAIRLWDGEVLAKFPGHGEWRPRKRPPSLMIKK